MTDSYDQRLTEEMRFYINCLLVFYVLIQCIMFNVLLDYVCKGNME